MQDSIKFQDHGYWSIVIVCNNQVAVEWGVIHSNGQEERAIGRLDYTFGNDGVVQTTRAHLCG